MKCYEFLTLKQSFNYRCLSSSLLLTVVLTSVGLFDKYSYSFAQRLPEGNSFKVTVNEKVFDGGFLRSDKIKCQVGVFIPQSVYTLLVDYWNLENSNTVKIYVGVATGGGGEDHSVQTLSVAQWSQGDTSDGDANIYNRFAQITIDKKYKEGSVCRVNKISFEGTNGEVKDYDVRVENIRGMSPGYYDYITGGVRGRG